MPFCPNCRCEFVDGIKKCSDCGVELVENLPPLENEEETLHAEWVKVLNVGSEEEAGMIVDVLKASNIPAVANSYITSSLSFINPKGVDILVPEEFKEQAVEVISATLPQEAKANNYDVAEQDIQIQNDEAQEDNQVDVCQDRQSIRPEVYAKLILKIIAIIVIIWFIFFGKGYIGAIFNLY